MRIKFSHKTLFQRVCILFLFSVFILPDYFALEINSSLPIISVQRIFEFILIVMIVFNKQKISKFFSLIKSNNLSILFLLYILVTLISALINGEGFNKSWIGIIVDEVVLFFIFAFIISYEFTMDKIIKLALRFTFILCILGLIEALLQQSIFAVLEITNREIWTGAYVRADTYRIMGPFNHSLGYGLFLICILPLSFLNLEKSKIDIFKHKLLSLLILINIFLTGSRSTVGILFLEILLLIAFTKRRSKIKIFIALFLISIIVVIYIYIFPESSISIYILRSIYSVLDVLFGTNFASNYGISSTYSENSVDYRMQLFKTFISSQINPFFGNGFTFRSNNDLIVDGTSIISVDNFYVAKYIIYGYVGLSSFLLIIFNFIYKMFNLRKKTGDVIFTACIVSTISYLIHLFVVNDLGTLKFLYLIFALVYCRSLPSYSYKQKFE